MVVQTTIPPLTPIKTNSSITTNLRINTSLFTHRSSTYEYCALAGTKTFRTYDVEKYPNYVVGDKMLERYADFELLEELFWLERVREEVSGLEMLVRESSV